MDSGGEAWRGEGLGEVVEGIGGSILIIKSKNKHTWNSGSGIL